MLVADDDDFALEDQDAPADDLYEEDVAAEPIDASADDDELTAPSAGISEFEILPLVLYALEAVQRGEGAEELSLRERAVRRRLARCELIAQRHAEHVARSGAGGLAHPVTPAGAAAEPAAALPEAPLGTAASAGTDAPAAEVVGQKRRTLPS